MPCLNGLGETGIELSHQLNDASRIAVDLRYALDSADRAQTAPERTQALIKAQEKAHSLAAALFSLANKQRELDYGISATG